MGGFNKMAGGTVVGIVAILLVILYIAIQHGFPITYIGEQ
jgi:hypothetical protein